MPFLIKFLWVICTENLPFYSSDAHKIITGSPNGHFGLLPKIQKTEIEGSWLLHLQQNVFKWGW